MARGATVESTLPGPGEDPEPEEFDEHGNPIEREELDVEEEEGEEAELEAEARRGGWRPLAEFKGDPSNFVSAREFVERGRNFVPFMRKDLESSRKTIDSLRSEVLAVRSELGEVKKLAMDFRDAAIKADQRGYERGLAEAKAKQRAAVESANVDQYDEATAEIEQLNAARPKDPVPIETKPNGKDPAPQPNGPVDPTIDAWIKKNLWFIRDPELNAAMQAEHLALLDRIPGLELEENLRRAKETVIKRFPAKFGVQPGGDPPPPPPRRRTASVLDPSAGGGAPPSNRRQLGIDSIEDETERAAARREYQRQKNAMPEFTEAQYMRLYNNPRADVLEVIKQKPHNKRA